MSVAEKPGQSWGESGRNPRRSQGGVASVSASRVPNCGEGQRLMEAVVERENMTAAYKRVVGNKGVAGADGMSVNDLNPHLQANWERIKSELLSGEYRPSAVREVEIGKPNGGTRKLGIPTVTDRIVGQAMHQIMKPLFEPNFSACSFGFIGGRSAHQAVTCAKRHVEEKDTPGSWISTWRASSIGFSTIS